jgi:hypothetical protein
MNNNQTKKLKYFFLQTKRVPTIFNEFKILDTPSKCTAKITKSQAKVV